MGSDEIPNHFPTGFECFETEVRYIRFHIARNCFFRVKFHKIKSISWKILQQKVIKITPTSDLSDWQTSYVIRWTTYGVRNVLRWCYVQSVKFFARSAAFLFCSAQRLNSNSNLAFLLTCEMSSLQETAYFKINRTKVSVCHLLCTP